MVSQEKKPIRVVLDTNVLISAILFHGSLSRFVIWWQNKTIIPLLSRETFDEFKEVLYYPKFQLSRGEINYIIREIILPFFEIVEMSTQHTTPLCRDPDDDIFLFTADQGRATYLISGDQDIVSQKKFHTTVIISPRDFISIMEKE